jgi:Mrp family chromosome partitioning ATPase
MMHDPSSQLGDALAWSIADERLAHCVGSIDAVAVLVQEAAPEEPPAPRPPLNEKSVGETAGAAPATEQPEAPATSQEVAPTRRRAFTPLAGLPALQPASANATTVPRLSLPRVVAQVLGDVPVHWRTLSDGLAARVRQDGLRTLAIATGRPGEGATTVAIALAVAVAERTDLKTVLLDADLADPSLATTLSIPASFGVERRLEAGRSLDEVVVRCERPKLDLLPMLRSAATSSNPSRSQAWESLLDELRSIYDLVVVDCGAVFRPGGPLAPPDGIDAALIVRDPAKSSSAELDELDAYLARRGICSLGVIENCVDG